MVYEYSSRRVYSGSSPRPGVTNSYSYTTSTPSTRTRQFVSVDPPGRDRNADDSSYSRTFSSNSSTSSSSTSSSSSGNDRPGTKVYSKKIETVTRDNGYGPQTTSHTTETTRTDGLSPSLFSSSSYRSPQVGSHYRHFTYKS